MWRNLYKPVVERFDWIKILQQVWKVTLTLKSWRKVTERKLVVIGGDCECQVFDVLKLRLPHVLDRISTKIGQQACTTCTRVLLCLNRARFKPAFNESLFILVFNLEHIFAKLLLSSLLCSSLSIPTRQHVRRNQPQLRDVTVTPTQPPVSSDVIHDVDHVTGSNGQIFVVGCLVIGSDVTSKQNLKYNMQHCSYCLISQNIVKHSEKWR